MLAILLAVLANLLIQRYVEPNQVYFRQVSEVVDRWEAKMRESHQNLHVVCGGSSGRFGINAQILLDEYDLPVVVANGNAGFGFEPSIALAWKFIRPGDTLILSNEDASLYLSDGDCTSSGLQQAVQRLGVSMFKDDMIPFTWKNFSTSLRGDAASISMAFAKLFFPMKKRYRYFGTAHIHPCSWGEIYSYSDKTFDARYQPKPSSLRCYNLTPYVDRYLRELLEKAKSKNVHVIYHQTAQFNPVIYSDRRAWLALQLTRLGIPVIKVPQFNLYSERSLFADTAGHMNKVGASIGTRQLGISLENQIFWKEDELLQILRNQGWTGEGAPISHMMEPCKINTDLKCNLK